MRFAWKCLPALILSLSLCGNSPAAVLTYFNFNNSDAGTGGNMGVFRTTGSAEIYDPATDRISIGTLGVHAAGSYVDCSNIFGTMGGSSSTDGNWGTFSGTTTNMLPEDTTGVGGALSLIGMNNNGRYVTFETSTLDYQNIQLTYATRGTSTGYDTQTWSYSTDGASFTDLPAITGRRSTTFSGQTVDLSSIAALNNQANVYLRVTFSGATGGSGNNRIDNVQIVGDDLGVVILTWNPSAGGTTWNTNTTSNWLNGSAASRFQIGDAVEFNDAALVGGVATVNVDATGVSPGSINVNTTGTYTFSNGSIDGAGAVDKNGTGELVLAHANSFSGGLNIHAGIVSTSVASSLGGGNVSLLGGTLKALDNLTVSNNLILPTGVTGTIDTNGFDVTFTGKLGDTMSGGYPGGEGIFVKKGDGTLDFAAPGDKTSIYQNSYAYSYVEAGTVKLSAASNNHVTGLGEASISINSSPNRSTFTPTADGATLWIDNIQVSYDQDTASNPVGAPYFIDLFDNARIKGTGNAVIAGKNVSVMQGSTTGGAANVVQLYAPTSNDSLTLTQSVQQYYSDATKPTNAVIEVNSTLNGVENNGRVVLQDGGVYSRSTFGGDWRVNGGILQIGPMASNTPSIDYAGPYGQPLNALGYKVPATLNPAYNPVTPDYHHSYDADPDLPNDVYVNGGVLAVGVQQVNINPNITYQPVNDTPAFLRNKMILAGGAIASTGNQASFGDTVGAPTDTPVTAQFGGDLTIALGTSRVLLYNPVVIDDGSGGYQTGFAPGPRDVDLVGNARTITFDSPAFAAGTVVHYNTQWDGVLVVDPGTETGGAFNIMRNDVLATASVGEDAELQLLSNAIVNVNGAQDIFHNSVSGNSVNVALADGAQFNVLEGTHQVGTVTGTGSVSVTGDATVLTASSVTADSLIIGGTPPTMAQAVPEPSAIALLVAAGGIGFLAVRSRRNRS
jgi:autotransporter-associated beta strand protein